MDDDKETFIALVHSEDGQEMLDSLKDKIKLREAEVEVDKALLAIGDSTKLVKLHINRQKFFYKL